MRAKAPQLFVARRFIRCKINSATSGAKALVDSQAFIAALEALRHPKPEFFSSLLSR
jgi:hypothetical protein